jgi:hypothetical protein
MYQNMTASGDVQKELGVLISGITAVLKLQLPLQLDLHRAVVVGTMHEGDMEIDRCWWGFAGIFIFTKR